ncbi:MAG TPA: hypothetical protein PKG63_08170 [Bacteroidales bacterium]|jgi:hypothetical protein|nr:hypothetical protein [Bacteroidales bacterium]HNV96433.1 hypothetical protein [Bacteroidales bacterium]HOU98026.1 hypothetical protein [Bacteroidales bacterium]
MEKQKKLRCPLGVPGGIMATLIGLAGIIMNSLNFNTFNLMISIALFLLAMPFVRVTMMIHSANDRLDELEKRLSK